MLWQPRALLADDVAVVSRGATGTNGWQVLYGHDEFSDPPRASLASAPRQRGSLAQVIYSENVLRVEANFIQSRPPKATRAR